MVYKKKLLLDEKRKISKINGYIKYKKTGNGFKILIF